MMTVPSNQQEQLKLLIELMSAREQGRRVKEIEEARVLHRSRELTEWAKTCREYNRQISCPHLKGGRKGRGRLARREFNISYHTFITGESRIICLNGCGFEVWNKPEWSFKWNRAAKMLNNTTNTPTSSEVPLLEVVINGNTTETIADNPTTREKLRQKYPLWNGIVKNLWPRQSKKEDTNAISFRLFSDIEIVRPKDDSNPIQGMKHA